MLQFVVLIAVLVICFGAVALNLVATSKCVDEDQVFSATFHMVLAVVSAIAGIWSISYALSP
jgi:hypothetical protein